MNRFLPFKVKDGFHLFLAALIGMRFLMIAGYPAACNEVIYIKNISGGSIYAKKG